MGDRIVIHVIVGILILGSVGLSQEVFAGIDPKLYSISVNTDKLYTINPNGANSITDATITLSGEVVQGATGLATHPITGELYAVLKIGNDRVLVKLNPDTGVATNIGTLSRDFSSITFNDAAILFGITGWGDSFDSKALYTINITNGVATRICGIGTGNFGESLAFRTIDDLFYHGTGRSDVFFDKFDSDLLNCNSTLINQDLTGLLPSDPPQTQTPPFFGEATALTWWPSQNAFLRAGGEPDLDTENGPYYLWKVPPDGSKPTLMGELDHKSKGLVVQVNGQTETLYSITPFDSKFRTVNPNTGGTIDGNPAINMDGFAATGYSLAQDSLGTIYSMVSTGIGGGGNPRTLVTLTESNPGISWTANAIGSSSSQRFSGLAFNANDDLFGLTGEAPQSDSLESIYQISTINGAESRKCGMAYGGFGEALGFNPIDGLMYRESGIEVKSFEKQRKKLPAYKDMTRSERETMVESSEKISKKLYPGGMKEQMEHYAEEGIKGDSNPTSFRKYKGKKIEGETYFERAKKAQKLREED